ncbi:hypothetical protein Bbelb_065070 [Branchiostoma belcheri]|nr:hypothetical protein Bbelb_065070 [Branchiostoma belcheri]
MERSGENLLQNFHRQVGGGNQWNPSSRWSGLPRRWGVGAKSVEQTTDVKKRDETVAEGRAEISRAAGRKYGIIHTDLQYTSRLLSSFPNLGVGDRARKSYVTLVAASGSSGPGQEIGKPVPHPEPDFEMRFVLQLFDDAMCSRHDATTPRQMVALPPDLTGRHLETGGQFRDSVPGPQAPSLTTGNLNSAVDSRVGNPDTPSSSQRGGATSAKTQRVLIMSPDHDFAEGVQHLN